VGKDRAATAALAQPGAAPASGGQIHTTQSSLEVWRDDLMMTKASKNADPVIATCGPNLKLFLENHEDFLGMFSYSEFAQTVVMMRFPDWWEGGDQTLGRVIDDNDIVQVWYRAIRITGMTGLHKSAVPDAIKQVALLSSFHPVKERLEKVKWDGVKRIDNWLAAYLGAEDSPYTRLIGAKFLIGAVARIFRPGERMDNTLIIEGKQGIGKSMSVQILSYGYFLDEHIDFKSKDGQILLAGNWIIEMAELTSMQRGDIESAKQFITKRKDTYRGVFETATKSHPRQCVFIGTTNSDDYLTDTTGNRRFWTVRITK
jgi:putative DNA primase/helicase